MKAYAPKVHYRWHPGYIAWLLHRITGLGLILYLFMHIYVIHHISLGRKEFDQVMALVQNPIAHLLEIWLLACVVFHGLNGIRVVLIDYGSAGEADQHRAWVWVTLAASLLLTVVGGIPMLMMALH